MHLQHPDLFGVMIGDAVFPAEDCSIPPGQLFRVRGHSNADIIECNIERRRRLLQNTEEDTAEVDDRTAPSYKPKSPETA